jgi:hypothetical protein
MHKTGTAAGLVALIAVFLHMQLAPQSEATAGNEKTGSGSGAEHAGSQAKSEESIEGPWIATRDYFHSGGDADASVALQPLVSPDSRSLDRAELAKFLGVNEAPNGTKMWSIVATVPDPLHTRMTLYLDGQIEAIERSLEEAGWDFAGQWLPWNDRFNGSERDINERRRQRRLQSSGEQMPGILIFRSGPEDDGFPAKRLLFILLVPETATSGISGKPFFAALNLAGVLASPENKIGLLAPTFSGSFSSLSALIKGWQSAHPAERRLLNVVYSGSVSNIDYAGAFKQATRMNFHAGAIDTRDYQEVFCQVLDDYHIDRTRAALLREDETAFGRSFLRPLLPAPSEPGTAKTVPCHGVRNYVFPRDISRLRNAYQEGNNPPARDPYADPSWNLNFSIRDPNSGEDSVPTFSEVQTPLAQEARIDAITQEFKRTGTQIVFIAAANSLDTLFLMRAIRRNAPDTRILIENPEILFIPAAARDPLGGTVLLSTYPMFASGDDWLDGTKQRDRLIFADPASQGVFNMTQFLLGDLGALQPPASPALRGYRQFQGGHPYPGMWVLTLTRYGFLPLDYHNHAWAETKSWNGGTCRPEEDCGWLRRNPDSTLPAFPTSVVSPRNWRITVFSVNVATILGCALLLWCNLSPVARKPYWLALTEGYGLRLQALLAATLSLTAVEWILISPELYPIGQLFSDQSSLFGFASPVLGYLLGIFFGLVALIGLVAPIVSLSFLLSLMRKREMFLMRKRPSDGLVIRKSGGSRTRAAVYPVIMLATFLMVTGGWTFLCYRAKEGAFFFRFRSLDLYSGSSPAIPLIILSAVFFFVSLLYFKRYTRGGIGRPRFQFELNPGESSPAVAFQHKLHSAMEGMELCILAPSGLTFWAGFRRTGIGLLALLLCLRVLGTYPLAFEPLWYNVLLWIELSLVLFWLAIGCYDFTLMWKRLRAMLDLVELLRLQPALKRVARDWPRRPVWAFRRSVSKHRLNRQMLYALHGRVVTLKALEQASAAESSKEAVAKAGAGGGVTTVTAAPTPITTAVQDAESDFEKFREAVDGDATKSLKPPKIGQILAGELPGAAHELESLQKYQSVSAQVAARILRLDLRPWWRQSLEEEDLIESREGPEKQESLYLKCCADFVALQCCRYVAYGVEHIQRIASCVSVTFMLLLIFFNSYAPQGPQSIARFFAALFLVVGYLMIRVFAQMERNPILSRISRTTPGELNGAFWLQLVSLGGLPLLGVLAHLFPSLSQFLFQWVAPGMQAAH